MAATDSTLQLRTSPSKQPQTGVIHYQNGTLGLIDDITRTFLAADLVSELLDSPREGDTVLYLVSSQRGVIIYERLIPANNSASAPVFDELEDGRLLFDAPNGLILQAGQSRIELQSDGTLLLDGREIQAAADGLNRLLGARIELN